MTREEILTVAKEAGFFCPNGLPSDWDEGDLMCSPTQLITFYALAFEAGVASRDLTFTTETVKYGCHCDLEDDEQPDSCVLDDGNPQDCIHAKMLLAAGKGRNDCKEWRPITILSKKEKEE